MLTTKAIVNFLLAGLACAVAWCIASTNPTHRKVGYWIGLFNQPLWAYISIESENYGVLVTCFVYTYAWMKGIVGHTERFNKFRKYFR